MAKATIQGKALEATLQGRALEYVRYLRSKGWVVNEQMVDKFAEFAVSELQRAKLERAKKPIVCHQCDAGAETMIEMGKHFSETGHTGASVRIGS